MGWTIGWSHDWQDDWFIVTRPGPDGVSRKGNQPRVVVKNYIRCVYFYICILLPSLSPLSPSLPPMSPPPPPPPPPPLCLPSFTRKGKKKQLDEHLYEKSASSHPSGSRSRSSRGSRNSLPASQRPSQAGSPLTRSGSYSPTSTITDAQSKAEMTSRLTSRAEKLTFTEDTESYSNLPKLAPKLDRSRTKLTRGGTFRSKFGYGWGLGLGRKDKDKEDLFTEVDRSSSATTILPIYPRGEAPPSFLPDDARTPTRHMSQRSKTSYASKQSKDTQASRATKSSGGSKQSNNSRSDSLNTLVGSALRRKEAYQDPIRERTDTTTQLAELRQLMAKDNLDY